MYRLIQSTLANLCDGDFGVFFASGVAQATRKK
jgi:hypothetical protein